jgi:hypothetical protein
VHSSQASGLVGGPGGVASVLVVDKDEGTFSMLAGTVLDVIGDDDSVAATTTRDTPPSFDAHA